MKNNKVNSNFLLLIIMLATILLSVATKPNLIIVEIFAAFYVLLIYRYFNTSNRKMLYYFAFLFSIVALGNRYNYYFVFFLYCIFFLKDIHIKELNIKNILKNKYTIFVIIFIGYMIISILWSSNKRGAIESLMRYAISISMMMMFIFENKDRTELSESLKFFRFLFLGILILGVLEILRVNLGLPNHLTEKGITHAYAQSVPVTFFNNPNNYAVFIIVGIILNADILIENVNLKFYYMSSISYILAIFNIIFTRSRTAFITGFLAIIFIFFIGIINWKQSEFRNKLFKFCVRFFFIGFIIYFLLSLVPSMDYYTEKFGKIPFVDQIKSVLNSKGAGGELGETIPPVIGEAGSDNVRFTIIYDITTNVVKNGNYLGVGVGNTYDFLKKVGNTNGTYAAHSYWFELLSDFGIGIFLYTILVYAHIGLKMVFNKKHMKSKLNGQYVIGITLLFSWTILAFGPSSLVSYPPFWISMGIIYSIYKIQFTVK